MMNLEIKTRNEFNKEFRKLNEKTEDQSYSSGCLMGYFEEPFKEIKIKDEDVYDNEDNEYGRELNDKHCTILYGLKDTEIDEDELVKLFSMIEGPEVTTNKISLFKNDKYDVVKWDIISDELTILNKMVCSMFPYKSDFPEYKAHATICYCLPGKGKKYEEELKKPLKYKISYWVYSKADGKKIKIVPGKKPEVIREATKEIKENLFCDTINKKLKDESFEYKGYKVNLTPNERFKDAYNCSVYLGDEYKMGLKGPCSLESGKDAAILFIDGQKEMLK